jgi:hypothetical protein
VFLEVPVAFDSGSAKTITIPVATPANKAPSK